MENLLQQIIKDASGAKFAEVRTVCQEVHDFLEAQQGSLRAPPHELRKRCFTALQLALESHNVKLVSGAVTGFQKLLRDDRFNSNLECESEEQWLPSQLLTAVNSLHCQSDDIQVDLLKVLLNMACATWWCMNESVILRILGTCQDGYVKSSTAVTIASQATASQTIRAFCDHLQKVEHENQANPFYNVHSNGSEESGIVESAFDRVVPIMHYLCKNVRKAQSGNLKERLVQFYLQCILTFVSSFPEGAFLSSALQSYLWQELCPTLLSLLGTPASEKAASLTWTLSASDNHCTTGRPSTRCSSVLSSCEAKTVYSICVELVRLVGTIESLRPMLESMFHRILLYTSPCHRLEALRATREVMRKPERLIHFGGPPLFVDPKGSCSTDLGLLKLAVDAFVECSHCSDAQVCYASIDCVSSLLESMERICEGVGLSAEYVTKLNSLYKDLDSCDYKGPMTYQTWEKLHNNALLKKLSVSSELSESDVCGADKCEGGEGDRHGVEKEANCGEMNIVPDEHPPDGGSLPSAVVDSKPSDAGPGEADTDGKACPSDVECDADPPSGYETDSSGSTEGPEEGYDNEEVMNASGQIADGHNEEEARRWQRLPRTLLGAENGRAEQERVAQSYETRDVYVQQERQNARQFARMLAEAMSSWLPLKSSIEADEIIQEFASLYCKIVFGEDTDSASGGDRCVHHMIINADGVYLAIYSALLLNLKLIQSHYYSEGAENSPPMTEEEFIENVHGSGVLVYLSADWLAELYQHVLSCNLLGNAGYDSSCRDNSALINLLTDLEGANGAYLLSDYYRLEKTVTSTFHGPEIDAGRKFARRVLTGCWDEVLEILSALLNGKNAVGISSNIYVMLGSEGAKDEHRRARDAIASSLNGLQKAARLSNLLNLHSRCESVFALLSAVSCPAPSTVRSKPTTPIYRKKLKSAARLGKPRPVKLHVAHVLSMDVMLSQGLELGSHSPDCWKHVFRCCTYLAELEHSFFSHGIAHSSATKPSGTYKENVALHMKSSEVDDFTVEEISLPPVQFSSGNVPCSAAEYIHQNGAHLSSSGVLSAEQNIKVLCSLSQQVDRLFDDAAYKLNLKSLFGFLAELCSSSRHALCARSARCSSPGDDARRRDSAGRQQHHRGGTVLLHRLGDVMLKCVRSGRPLIHIMQAWSVFGLHLMEAACNSDQDVAKHSITCIHDTVGALLNNQAELPYFHFNEALFKPFENLLCLELCDTDIQDQIVSSICEFVETSKTEIRSGWRPLFGALRAVRSAAPVNETGDPGLGSNHVRAVLDVFDAFLNTDNVLVFANAAVDCILCLLKHIRGSDVFILESKEAFEKSVNLLLRVSVVNFLQGESANDSDDLPVVATSPDLCLASLKCIHTCCRILACMHQMPVCPIFHASSRIQLGSETQFVDPQIPGRNLVVFGNVSNNGSSVDTSVDGGGATDHLKGIEWSNLHNNLTTLDDLEQASGILHVWCLILEGLVGAVTNCPRRYQPYTVETLFFLLRKIFELPGVDFGLHVVNHILLPMMQSWLRGTSRMQSGWGDSFASNFKQCCGQTTDLVVDYITKLSDANQLQASRGGTLLLYQLFVLMTECIAQPNESISRLGCSCIRHVIVAAGPLLTPELWEVACDALRRACDISLFFVRQLMAAFNTDSDNFYGDMAQVKVAVKSDCSSQENERLKQVAQQVFLLDNQRPLPNGLLVDDAVDDDRSYVFLLYPHGVDHSQNSETLVVKVPFHFMVVGLVSHQILLQTIAVVLLHGLPHVVPSLANVLLQSPSPTPSSAQKQPLSGPASRSGGRAEPELPGMIRYLSKTQLSTLLDCLQQSYEVSCQFDSRPGLKFLVQKVARASAAANLYKQSGASWTIRTVALLELCLHRLQTGCDAGDRIGGVRELLKVGEFCFTELQATLNDVCSSYAELFVKKDDDRFARLQDQPIFFLVAHTDDFMENRHKGDEAKAADVEQPRSAVLGTASSPKEEHGAEEVRVTAKAEVESPEAAQDALAELQDKEAKDETDEEEEEDSEEDDTTRVYEVATQKDIDTVVKEYKKRKQQRSMPSATRDTKRISAARWEESSRNRNHEGTKLPSVLKDHQACVKVRTEMLLSVFDFFCQMDDSQFNALLPITFPFVRSFVNHGDDQTLRQTVAEFLDRIASLYCFIVENS